MLLVLTAYLPALRCGFIWDDDNYVTDNPMLGAPDGLSQIWFSAHTQSQYFPLVYTTFRYEYQLWGLNPVGYHLVNILLHGGNAVLVWMVLRRLQIPGAWLAAALFGLHPVQVESVAWVTELKNIESLLFYLLAVLAWIKFFELSVASRWYFYGLALVAYLLALFAKTTACTLPAALILTLWLRGRRIHWSRVVQILPFLILGLGSGLLSIWWEKHLGNYHERFGLSFDFLQRTLISACGLWFYVGKLVWPLDLAFSYPHWTINPRTLWPYLPLAGWAGVAAMLWKWQGQIGRAALAGIIFYVAALSPMLGFINAYTFFYTFVADHYQYPATIGLLAVAGATFWRWLSKSAAWIPAQMALLMVLGSLTWQQCGAYRNPETLWRDTLAKNQSSWMAHHNLGIELLQKGQLDDALEQFQAAVILFPDGDQEQCDLGVALMEKNQNVEAIEHLKKAVALNPELFQAQNNLAMAYLKTGESAQAVAHFRKAIQLKPEVSSVQINLGSALEQQGKADAAIDVYRAASRQFSTEVEPLRRLAEALIGREQFLAAIQTYRQAIHLSPNRTDLLVGLGNLYLTRTNYSDAADCYRQALRIEPASAGIHYNLGIVEGLQGQVEFKRRELTECLRLNPDFTAARQELQQLDLEKPH